jgi:sporulation protein YlmC with PRC-barrel domain
MRKQLIAAVTLATAFAIPSSFAQTASESHDTSSSALQSKESSHLKEIRASKLIGVNVSSKDGSNFGQVQDLIVNPKTGKIRFALVGKGFMAGEGTVMVPIPWKAISVQSERQFVLNVDQSKLGSAPAWSETQVDQPDYVIRVYRFYQIEPESDTSMGGTGSSDQQSGQGQGTSSDTQQSGHSSANHNPSEHPSQPQQ